MKIPEIPRRDLLILAGGLVFLIVLALFVKPMIAGPGTAATGSALPDSLTSRHLPVPIEGAYPDIPQENAAGSAASSPASTTPVPSPSPPPTVYLGMPTIALPFVDPATFNITLEREGPERSLPEFPEGNTTRMVTYAEINGKSSGVSGSYHVPASYWELWYTVDPGAYYVGDVGEAREQSIAEVRGAVWWPSFSIDVYEMATPPRLIRTLTPDGGLDPDLWANETNDPRPWKAKFFSGDSDYFLVLHARNLKSYRASVMLPTEVNMTSLTPVPTAASDEEYLYDVG